MEPPPAAPTRLDAGHRFRAFAGDFGQVESTLESLESSGFYWAALSGSEAEERLCGQPVGTFLLRDSSDHRHLFTLSVRTEAGITNLRVQQRRGLFHLETAGPEACFDCVVKLADHYVRLSEVGAAGAGRAALCYLEGLRDPLPLLLLRPLLRKVAALQELCRRALTLRLARVGGSGGPGVRAQLEALPLPSGLKERLGS